MTTDNQPAPDEMTIANYIGTDACTGCGKTDEVLNVTEDLMYCQECVSKAFANHWGIEARVSPPGELIGREAHHLLNWLWCERCRAWIETQHRCGAQYIDRGTHYEEVHPAAPVPATTVDARALAEEIATELFTNGAGHEATRLILYNMDDFLGGWSKNAATNRIEPLLSKHLAAAPADKPTQLIVEHIGGETWEVHARYESEDAADHAANRLKTAPADSASSKCPDCGHDDQSKAARMYGCSEGGSGVRDYCNCQNPIHRIRPTTTSSVSEDDLAREAIALADGVQAQLNLHDGYVSGFEPALLVMIRRLAAARTAEKE